MRVHYVKVQISFRLTDAVSSSELHDLSQGEAVGATVPNQEHGRKEEEGVFKARLYLLWQKMMLHTMMFTSRMHPGALLCSQVVCGDASLPPFCPISIVDDCRAGMQGSVPCLCAGKGIVDVDVGVNRRRGAMRGSLL
ncbi:hypothetical protein CBR_g21233 [Chara braunii]|uniref:Uncharacterized protein n=1 Tax=Chara braunii TaxID=69332 RepID=A0A388L189_CHABU|nr:hypothetical protein CBR_g21233 [Chara braunii]|eukprot:GBG75992.1 hypothetical protein CBR_g21233 [Chara braunii]